MWLNTIDDSTARTMGTATAVTRSAMAWTGWPLHRSGPVFAASVLAALVLSGFVLTGLVLTGLVLAALTLTSFVFVGRALATSTSAAARRSNSAWLLPTSATWPARWMVKPPSVAMVLPQRSQENGTVSSIDNRIVQLRATAVALCPRVGQGL